VRASAAAVFLLVGCACAARATDFSQGAAGTAGSQFLLLDTSARGIALGGAMTAVTDDANSIYWNPAGLAQVPRTSASFMFANYVGGITYNDISFAQRVDDASVFAGGARYLNAGTIPQTDINGNSAGTFSPYDLVGEIGWGQSVYDLSDSQSDILMGVTGRVIHSSLGNASANGFGGDIGILSRLYTSERSYDVGFVVQNIGSGQKFDQVRQTLPTRVRFGASFKPIPQLLLTGEAVAPISENMYGAAGVEYTAEFDRNVAGSIRVGLSSQNYNALGFASVPSFGLGLKLNDFTFDYAYQPMGVLGNDTASQRLSVSFNLPAKASSHYRDR
jgi:hypothetical protein